MLYIYISIAELLIIIILIILEHKRIGKLNAGIISKNVAIQNNFEIINKLTDEKKEFKDRVIKLENSIEHGYGIKTRIEVTEVIVDFTKLEMVLLLSGLSVLLKSNIKTEDMKYIIKLLDKLQEAINDMKEEDV